MINFKKFTRVVFHPFYKSDEPIELYMLGRLIASLCPYCGKELEETEHRCSICGLKIKRRV